MYKKIILLLIPTLLSLAMSAQQTGLYSNYMFSMQEFNPAYAGSRGVLSAVALHRSQWTGFDGAPSSEYIAVSSPTPFYNLCGGFSIASDRIGPLTSNSLSLDVAHSLKLSEKVNLRYGVKLNGQFNNARFGDLNVIETTDAAFTSNLKSKMAGNIGFGTLVEFGNYYVGISSPRMVNRTYKAKDNAVSVIESKNQVLMNAGGYIAINKDFALRPAAIMRLTHGAPVQFDINATCIYKNLFWLGLLGRTGDAFGVQIGGNVKEMFQVGYAIDLSVGGVNGYTSHEVVLRYDLIKGDKKLDGLHRYF